jgi:cytochrome P450
MVFGLTFFHSGITISSIFYFLLKNRRCYTKLMKDLDALGDPKSPVSFAVAQKLPYLNAVFQESVRCHLLVRLPNTREVPAGGLAICGKWVPPGVCVGVYPSVLRHKKEIFGEDVDMFRPERWLDDTEKVTRMSNAMFTFGYGKYSCIGKNIAKLEVLKLIPSVLREFEVRFGSGLKMKQLLI